LLNHYDVIELNPKSMASQDLPKPKSWPTGWCRPKASKLISAYQVNGEKLFNASAASPK
jgi:tungstate transport system substrate-binding protein